MVRYRESDLYTHHLASHLPRVRKSFDGGLVFQGPRVRTTPAHAQCERISGLAAVKEYTLEFHLDGTKINEEDETSC